MPKSRKLKDIVDNDVKEFNALMKQQIPAIILDKEKIISSY
jgi:hypothetical protein